MRRAGFKRKFKPNKYKAKKTKVDNIIFDSMLEASQYEELKLLERAKEIEGLDLQHELILKVNGKQICIYIADFFYFDNSIERWVVSDAKGVQTDVFKIKWKLAQALYPEYVYELRKKGKVIRV